MLNPKQIKDKLKDRKLSVVAEHTGLTVQTLWYIRSGKSKAPAFDTIEKLSNYFEENL
jgi:transcriptional regulator with XRE-family HTH domain